MRKATTREAVLQAIRDWILSGAVEPGQFLSSERDLVRQFGVSRVTVRTAVESLVREGVLIREPNCRPIVKQSNSPGQNGPAKIKDQIAVWIQPDLQDFGAASILQGIRTAVEGNNFDLLVGFPPAGDCDEEKSSEFEFLETLVHNASVAGAIVWEAEGAGFTSVYLGLQEARIPVVFIDREPPEIIEADVVSTNNKRGAKKAVSHLISLGHKAIAMVINDESVSSVRDRLDGYRAALFEAGIPFLSDLVFEVEAGAWHTQPGGPEAFVRKILTTTPHPTAVFAVNDGTAVGIHEVMIGIGIRVPDDVSLVGFDWLFRSLPGGGDLTTVAQPFEAIGRVAAQRLIERINQKASNVPRHILLEAPLVIRSTSGAPPKAAQIAGELLLRRN